MNYCVKTWILFKGGMLMEKLVGKTISNIKASNSHLEILFDDGSMLNVDIGTFVGVEPFLDYEVIS